MSSPCGIRILEIEVQLLMISFFTSSGSNSWKIPLMLLTHSIQPFCINNHNIPLSVSVSKFRPLILLEWKVSDATLCIVTKFHQILLLFIEIFAMQSRFFLLLLQIIISYFMGRTKKFFAHKQVFHMSLGDAGRVLQRKINQTVQLLPADFLLLCFSYAFFQLHYKPF